MTPRTRTLMIIASFAFAGLASPARAGPLLAEPTAPESAGQFVDSSVITTQVKAALLDDPALKSFQIKVETFKNVVQLSGFVDTLTAVRRAGEVARAIRGVASVRNDLIVK